jgi:hypothetical protein
MLLPRERRAKAAHFYHRESVTALPRIRALGRVQAWRAGDGEQARPISTAALSAPAAARCEELRHAA